jgi:excisionase family DNA binding protein
VPPTIFHVNGSARFANQSNGVDGSPVLTLTVALSSDQLDALAGLVAERLRPAPSEGASPWLDTKGAAAHLACGVGRVHDLVALGKLEPRRDGRRLLFKRVELDEYLEASR